MCSADGTRIGFRRLGVGPAIVMVHGSVSTHTDWMPAARLLASRHTCYVMDRRGRRSSGAGHAPYAIEREFEDVCAVLKAAKTSMRPDGKLRWPATPMERSAPWARHCSAPFQS